MKLCLCSSKSGFICDIRAEVSHCAHKTHCMHFIFKPPQTEHHKWTCLKASIPLSCTVHLCGIFVSRSKKKRKKLENKVQICLSGPSDVHIYWLINGYDLDAPVMEYRHPLGQGDVLVSSWLREGPLVKDARYRCVAEASTGNDMSEVDLRLTVGGICPVLSGHIELAQTCRRFSWLLSVKGCCCLTDEEGVASRDWNQWRGALAEHEQLLRRWQKAWVGLGCRLGTSFNLLCMFGFWPPGSKSGLWSESNN